MKLHSLLLPAALLGAAIVVTLPRSSTGFALLGTSIDANECGFQVNPTSFTDPASNDNVVPDANFPGALGAAMACWKAADEWNSELRGGNGNGDPLQPGALGSGNSNFDFMYHGTTTGTGGGTSAVIKAGGFIGNGIFAVTGSTNSGWNMTFDNSAQNNWNWVDGPGNQTGGLSTDIQGICCHELGHSLGLNHSNVGGTTMFAGTTPGGSPGLRSIEADDAAGVQAIYGAKSGTKPKINSVTGSLFIGGVITITGVNFTATGNEVWFTRDTGGATFTFPATPIKVTSLASSGGGTTINVTVPNGVAKGDIIVHRSGAASSHSLKSAPFPFDLGSVPLVPFISSLSPNPIVIASAPIPPTLIINGSGFSSATSVAIGIKTYTSGQFTIVNSGQITVAFNPPPLNTGNNIPVTVTTPVGTSNASLLTINKVSGHVQFISNDNPPAGSTVTFYYFEPTAGQTILQAYSTCFGFQDFSPYFVLDIGGTCGVLGFITPIVPPTDANGMATQTIVLDPFFHGLILTQHLPIDLANAIFPLPKSNVVFTSVP